MCCFGKRVVIFIILCEMMQNLESHLTKRAPLEFGLVTFPTSGNSERAILLHKNTAEIGLKIGLSVPKSSKQQNAHDKIFNHEWIPGKVRQHIFIPPHIHHYFLPILITKEVIVKPYETCQTAYGGFGVGSLTGGHGAGHGLHVIMND